MANGTVSEACLGGPGPRRPGNPDTFPLAAAWPAHTSSSSERSPRQAPAHRDPSAFRTGRRLWSRVTHGRVPPVTCCLCGPGGKRPPRQRVRLTPQGCPGRAEGRGSRLRREASVGAPPAGLCECLRRRPVPHLCFQRACRFMKAPVSVSDPAETPSPLCPVFQNPVKSNYHTSWSLSFMDQNLLFCYKHRVIWCLSHRCLDGQVRLRRR